MATPGWQLQGCPDWSSAPGAKSCWHHPVPDVGDSDHLVGSSRLAKNLTIKLWQPPQVSVLENCYTRQYALGTKRASNIGSKATRRLDAYKPEKCSRFRPENAHNRRLKMWRQSTLAPIASLRRSTQAPSRPSRALRPERFQPCSTCAIRPGPPGNHCP